jgi:MFS family permease
LIVAQISLGIELVAYTLMSTLTPRSELFVIVTVLASFGAGFSPAAQAVALAVFSRRPDGRETGKLFGAISVVQALG